MMTNFQQITLKKFSTPNAILDYFNAEGVVFRVDPDTKDRIYAINPDTRRSYTFLVKDTADGYLKLEKI